MKEDGRAAVEMGIDIATYRARICGFGLRKKIDRGVQVKGQESSLIKTCFLGFVIAVLLVIAGVEVNPGPQVEQGKIDQMLAYVKNQEKESKIIKQMVELHKQEMAEMKKSTDALGLKFDCVSEIVSEIMNDYGQVKQAIKEWEMCHQRTEASLTQQMKQCVYSIPCDCNRSYISETSRPLEVRIKEHKYNLTQG
jgi:hypothetical protein